MTDPFIVLIQGECALQHSRLALALILILVAAASGTLTGWTVNNWRDSHAALQRFDAALTAVRAGEAREDFAVTVTFTNESDSRTQIEFMGLDVYCQGRLVVTHNWFPEDFSVPAREHVEETFQLQSNLPQEVLQELSGDDEDWEARMRFRISHPAQDDTFLVDVRRGLKD